MTNFKWVEVTSARDPLLPGGLAGWQSARSFVVLISEMEEHGAPEACLLIFFFI